MQREGDSRMSLRDAIRQAVQQGITALDDLALLSTYTSVGTPSYTPSTGTITTPNTAYTNVPVAFTSFDKKEIDGKTVKPNDQKAIIACLDLAATPTLNDTITAADGTVWSVMGIQRDPAGAVWVLQVRRP